MTDPPCRLPCENCPKLSQNNRRGAKNSVVAVVTTRCFPTTSVLSRTSTTTHLLGLAYVHGSGRRRGLHQRSQRALQQEDWQSVRQVRNSIYSPLFAEVSPRSRLLSRVPCTGIQWKFDKTWSAARRCDVSTLLCPSV